MPARAVKPSHFPWLDPERYAFSPGVEAIDTVWLSGQTAATYDAEHRRIAVQGGAGQQAALCWDKVEAILEGAGRSSASCGELVEYLTPQGLAERDAVAAARRGERDASIMVVESLLRRDALVEVEAVAGDAEGLLRLPQILPFDRDGKVVAPGDLVAQAEFVLEEAGRQLAARGLDLGHVVRTVEQTTPATRGDYRATGKARRRLLGPAFPASTGVLSPALPHPDALVALEVWASPLPKAVVNPGWSAFEALTFSPGVRAGRALFISGTAAWDPVSKGNVAPGDIAAQAAFVYEQIAAVCEAAGGGLDDVVKTVEYVAPAGLEGYRDVGALRREIFSGPLPASTGVVVSGLLSSAWLIEVEALAILP